LTALRAGGESVNHPPKNRRCCTWLLNPEEKVDWRNGEIVE